MNPNPGPCGVCGRDQIARYQRGDKLFVGTCCILIGVRVAERHSLAQRIHDTVHGYPGEGCPVCAANKAHEMMWGDPAGGER